ncbi:Na+/H+ antiporter subunit E [Actinoplanes sp. NBRC 14428]|uniref:Multisubunit sodium/proton antiporter MrpE subunit n=1 Tax=Pseudosporangium ferrugineum TaxID=439699 RepID=A0A2T0SEZ7_9ACTN|nr:Na+/H+ antiporter subunit E [Pseudosporangium ferrugineum]PRY31987.1 multisubunit sodium/proton antiporter MrpE subunit [Pseudosporangium ferrugineum]BCJ49773.1 Na+/H+ antiporter subunit E [Actinoplanes sp. NBRC 14428]
MTRAGWRDRLVAAAGLVAVWMLLWGVFSWAHLIGGIVVAAVVLRVFPLPPVTFAGRPRVRGLLRFAARFTGDLVVASVQLAALAFRFGHQPRSAIIRVPLRVPSDLVLTLTGEAVSLVPGSLIVDTDQASTTLYIHVIGVSGRDAVERFRRSVYETEARIVRAVGSDAEIRMLDSRASAGKGEHP